jgi:hypothetical protein
VRTIERREVAIAIALRIWSPMRCAAGNVTRPELHEGNATRKALTWHDLRATGLTWMAVRGDDPLKIKRRAGHSTFTTTVGYIREAEAVRDGFGEVFPPLPTGPLGIAPKSPRAISRSRDKPKTSRTRWRRRESNRWTRSRQTS